MPRPRCSRTQERREAGQPEPLLPAGTNAHPRTAPRRRERPHPQRARRPFRTLHGSFAQGGTVNQGPNNPGGGDDPPQDENKLIAERRAKLAEWREQAKAAGIPAFPNDFRRDVLASLLLAEYGEKPAEWFDANP